MTARAEGSIALGPDGGGVTEPDFAAFAQPSGTDIGYGLARSAQTGTLSRRHHVDQRTDH